MTKKKKNPLVIPNAEILDIEHIIKDPKCEPKQLDIVSLNVIIDFDDIKHEILSDSLIANVEKTLLEKFI